MITNEPDFLMKVGVVLTMLAVLIKSELFSCIVICWWGFVFFDWLYWKYVEYKFQNLTPYEDEDDDDGDEHERMGRI